MVPPPKNSRLPVSMTKSTTPQLQTSPVQKIFSTIFSSKVLGDTADGQNPAPPRMMIIPLFVGF